MEIAVIIGVFFGGLSVFVFVVGMVLNDLGFEFGASSETEGIKARLEALEGAVFEPEVEAADTLEQMTQQRRLN